MQPLVWMGVVFVTALVWVGVILTMLAALDRTPLDGEQPTPAVRDTEGRTPEVEVGFDEKPL